MELSIDELEEMTIVHMKKYGFEMMTRVLAEACRRRSEDLAGAKDPDTDMIGVWEDRANELDAID